MRVAVLGLGEAGTIYAEGFAENGHAVVGYDPSTSSMLRGVEQAAGVADAVRAADLVLSLVTAAHATAVAQDAAQHLADTAIYADLNAASPQRKHEVADSLGSAAQRYVDVAVIGSVPKFGVRTSLVVSGPVADEAAVPFRSLGADVDAIGGRPGDASRRKILRTVFMKGLGGIITEAMDAGTAAGETAWVRAQIAAELADGEKALDRLDVGTRRHALRRAHESDAAADLVSSLGLVPAMTTATADRHRLLACDEPHDLPALLEVYATVPTAAIGDARDRLGIVDPRIRAQCPGAHLAGRALPVTCRPGDNSGVHEAIRTARPGDVIVVNGGGDGSRALMGELIAQRAINRGVRGMVVDGAVRDVEALQKTEFPVWAVGRSPAGPYKSGPFRLGEDVAVGGVVVHRGDIVVGDDDGVIVVPVTDAERVLAGARAVLDDEASRHRAILAARPD